MHIEHAKTVMLRTHLAALKHNHRANGLYLESGPGIGKSDSVFQAAEKLASTLNEPVGVVQFMLATISSVDVRGFMLPVKAGDGLNTVFSTPPWFPTVANTHVVEPDGTWHLPGTWSNPVPRVGMLFLDEFAQAEEEVKKPAAELIYKGNVGTCGLSIGWRVIAAGNRTSDRSGVMRELMFLVNRRCRLSIDPSLPAWLDWASRQPPENRPHYMTIAFAQQNPDIVFRDKVPEGTDPFATPRTLCLMDRDLIALRSGEDEAQDRLPMDDISREVAAGWIGDGGAAQFWTHLKYADQLPSIEDIEKDPAKAKLPSGKDAQMVIAYMLAHKVVEDNAGSIIKYIERLNIEMQVLAIRAISAQKDRAKAIVVQPGYMGWLKKNKELLIASQS
jgi:hypothetical protein